MGKILTHFMEIVTIWGETLKLSKLTAGQKKCAFDDEVTSVQRGIVGFISHYQARQFANTLASLGYNKKCVTCTHYLGEINSAMQFLIVKFV